MGSLVFGQAMEDNPYADLFDQGQWDKLVRLFYQELFKLHGMTHESLLSIELQVQCLVLQWQLTASDSSRFFGLSHAVNSLQSESCCL